jgi:4-cresol dehydrogenase (hydroxylating)
MNSVAVSEMNGSSPAMTTLRYTVTPTAPLWGRADELVASIAVAPSSVEQVQAIVVTANKYKIPLYPISTGKNLGYGGSAPNYSGSVIVDLKRMNKIIEVDDKRNYCIVEPGGIVFRFIRLHHPARLESDR